MDVVRVIIAVALFCISSYLVFDLFANGFQWLVFIVAVFGFIAVHYLWPKKGSEESEWYDLLEYVVDIPYRAISLFLRSAARLFRKSDSDFDLDL